MEDGANNESVNLSDLLAGIATMDPTDAPAVLAAVAARLALAKPEPDAPADELLDVEAAAALLGVSPSWLHHRPKLPFRLKVGGKLKFRRSGVERWLRQRQGA